MREAMEQGAIGLSSGLDYPPGAYATTDELAQLTAEATAHGGFYHTHVRYALGEGIEQTYDWFLANQSSARGVTAAPAS